MEYFCNNIHYRSDVTTEEWSFNLDKYRNSLVIFDRDANGLIRFNDLC